MGTICIDRTTPLFALTVGQFEELVRGNQPEPEREKVYLYGLRGICDLFHISKKTAVEWKKTWLAPAISQYERSILTDKEMAVELFRKQSDLKGGSIKGGSI